MTQMPFSEPPKKASLLAKSILSKVLLVLIAALAAGSALFEEQLNDWARERPIIGIMSSVGAAIAFILLGLFGIKEGKVMAGKEKLTGKKAKLVRICFVGFGIIIISKLFYKAVTYPF